MASIRCYFIFIFLFSYQIIVENTRATCDLQEVFNDFILCKDGHIERTTFLRSVPPSLDLELNVDSKDVVYSSVINQSVRIFLPLEAKNQSKKLPVLVYYHGGSFVVGNTSNPPFHNMSKLFAAEAKVIVVSTNYRLAPENPLPIAFNDSWTAFQWVASHLNGNGSEEWLNLYADFDKVFLMGDSAGGTIAHNMALRQGQETLSGINLRGMILQMPYFLLNDSLIDIHTKDLYDLIYPNAQGVINWLLDPADDPNFGTMGGNHTLVMVGELDELKDMQYMYFDKLAGSTWKGKAELIEIKGAKHMFNLRNSSDEKTVTMRKQMVDSLVSWMV